MCSLVVLLFFSTVRNLSFEDGVLRVVSQQTRSQAANRELAMQRFVGLMREAVRQAPVRKKTRVSRAAKARRLEEKGLHGVQKKERWKKISVDDGKFYQRRKARDRLCGNVALNRCRRRFSSIFSAARI